MLLHMYRAVVRWVFQRFYNEFAWTYNSVAWLVSRGMWKDWTLAAVPYLRGRILELGCGTGYVQHALASLAFSNSVGLDASPFMLARTQRRLCREGFNAQLLRAVAQAIPCRDKSFDTVLATFPSEYILSPDTLAEIARVLSPNGQLVIVDGARFTHAGWYEQLVDLVYRVVLGVSLRQNESADYTLDNPYVRVFEQAGFHLTCYQEQVRESHVMVMVGQRI